MRSCAASRADSSADSSASSAVFAAACLSLSTTLERAGFSTAFAARGVRADGGGTRGIVGTRTPRGGRWGGDGVRSSSSSFCCSLASLARLAASHFACFCAKRAFSSSCRLPATVAKAKPCVSLSLQGHLCTGVGFSRLSPPSPAASNSGSMLQLHLGSFRCLCDANRCIEVVPCVCKSVSMLDGEFSVDPGAPLTGVMQVAAIFIRCVRISAVTPPLLVERCKRTSTTSPRGAGRGLGVRAVVRTILLYECLANPSELFVEFPGASSRPT
eukprot:scaffold105609_cov35-Tisochrysis_lutea.AAC.1